MRRSLSVLSAAAFVWLAAGLPAHASTVNPTTPPSTSTPTGQPAPSTDDAGTTMVTTPQTEGRTTPIRPGGKASFWKKDKISAFWPADASSLWVPVREGRYSTEKPINATTVSARLSGNGFDEELVRLTKGNDVTTILFKMPNLTPGKYQIDWTEGAETTSTTFEIQDPVLAPGGGNHRHESTNTATPWSQRISLAFVAITGGVALLTVSGLWWIPLAVLAGIGAITSLTASVGAFVTGYNGAGFGESAWAAGFAAPGVWGYLLIALVLSVMPLARALPASGRLAAVGALSALGAGAGHLHAAVPQYQTVIVSVVVGMAGAATIAAALTAIRPAATVALRDRTLIAATLVVSAAASVFVHSLFAAPTGAFVDAYVVRAIAGASLLAAVVSIRPWGGSRIRRAVSVAAVAVATVAVIVLTQVPPLTAGL